MKNVIEENQEERSRFIAEEDNSTKRKEENSLVPTNTEELQNALKCGIASYRPNWLQVFLSQKWYTCVYSLILVSDFMQASYFFGTLSSIEKNFEMTATMLGILKSIFELGYLLTSVSLSYFIGKGNKIRWISTALLINGIFNLVRIVPHFIDTNTSSKSLSTVRNSNDTTWFQKDVNLTTYAFYFFTVAQLMTGMGRAIVKTSGLTYLDHNTSKNSFPMFLAIVGAVGELGSSLGYLISFYALKIYVYPNESLNYTNKSYQWIGAWWLGWIPVSVLCIVLSISISVFPQRLPRGGSRKMITHRQQPEDNKISVSDFYSSCKRILRNKLAILDILATIMIRVAFSGYQLFFPKYLESQYNLSSSFSSFLLGELD